MGDLTENLCTTRWTINGHVKRTFVKQMNKPSFMSWYYLNKVKCVSSGAISIGKIQYPYFIGLSDKDIKIYKKEYKKYKNVMYHKHKNDIIYIFTDKKYFDIFLSYQKYLDNEKNINEILKNSEIKKIIKKMKIKNNEKNIFVYKILVDIIKKYSYKNIKIMSKFCYYKRNFKKNNDIFSNYHELYANLKKKGIEKNYNESIKKLYENLKKIIYEVPINKIKNYKYFYMSPISKSG
jgi:hypothetical protein